MLSRDSVFVVDNVERICHGESQRRIVDRDLREFPITTRPALARGGTRTRLGLGLSQVSEHWAFVRLRAWVDPIRPVVRQCLKIIYHFYRIGAYRAFLY